MWRARRFEIVYLAVKMRTFGSCIGTGLVSSVLAAGVGGAVAAQTVDEAPVQASAGKKAA